MTKRYKQGEDALFYVIFLSEDGGSTPIVINPIITIKHYESGTLITDVSEASLIQEGTSNKYYYQWSIPSGAFIGTYSVIYNAEIDGVDVEFDEEFQIYQPDITQGGLF